MYDNFSLYQNIKAITVVIVNINASNIMNMLHPVC